MTHILLSAAAPQKKHECDRNRSHRCRACHSRNGGSVRHRRRFRHPLTLAGNNPSSFFVRSAGMPGPRTGTVLGDGGGEDGMSTSPWGDPIVIHCHTRRPTRAGAGGSGAPRRLVPARTAPPDRGGLHRPRRLRVHSRAALLVLGSRRTAGGGRHVPTPARTQSGSPPPQAHQGHYPRTSAPAALRLQVRRGSSGTARLDPPRGVAC